MTRNSQKLTLCKQQPQQPHLQANGQTSKAAEDIMHHNKKKGLKASQSFDEAVLGGQDEEQLQVHN